MTEDVSFDIEAFIGRHHNQKLVFSEIYDCAKTLRPDHGFKRWALLLSITLDGLSSSVRLR